MYHLLRDGDHHINYENLNHWKNLKKKINWEGDVTTVFRILLKNLISKTCNENKISKQEKVQMRVCKD